MVLPHLLSSAAPSVLAAAQPRECREPGGNVAGYKMAAAGVVAGGGWGDRGRRRDREMAAAAGVGGAGGGRGHVWA